MASWGFHFKLDAKEWCLMMGEAEAGWLKVWGHPGLQSKNLAPKTKQSWACWLIPVIPEVGKIKGSKLSLAIMMYFCGCVGVFAGMYTCAPPNVLSHLSRWFFSFLKIEVTEQLEPHSFTQRLSFLFGLSVHLLYFVQSGKHSRPWLATGTSEESGPEQSGQVPREGKVVHSILNCEKKVGWRGSR